VRLGIGNEPSADVIANLRQLCVNVLEPVREHFGRPVTVHSGFRCPALNRAVGGAASSQHVEGEAADIEIRGIANAALARWITGGISDGYALPGHGPGSATAGVPFDQLILEFHTRGIPDSGWVHVSYRPRGRGEVLTAERISGRTVYSRGIIA